MTEQPKGRSYDLQPDPALLAKAIQEGTTEYIKFNKILIKLTSNIEKTEFPLTAEEVNFVLVVLFTEIYTQHQINPKTALKIVSKPVAVVGDLHGSYEDLHTIVNRVLYVPVAAGLPGGYYRHRVNMCFLGDYVDRGDQSLRTVLNLLILSFLRPTQITLLRGNHEFEDCNSDTFLKELVKHFKEKDGKIIHYRINQVFSYMPLSALLEEKVLLVHGGLSPDMNSIEKLINIPLPIRFDNDNQLVQDIVWSDPNKDSSPDDDWEWNDIRDAGKKFSKTATTTVLKNLGVQLLIRAHEVVVDGISSFYEKLVLSVFSATFYMKQYRTASFLYFDEMMRISPIHLVPERFKNQKGFVQKDEEEDEKSKKVANPKQNKNNVKAAITAATLIAFSVIALFGYFHYNTATEKIVAIREVSQPLNGPVFADMSAKLARVVNGLSISQSIKNDELDGQQLMDELFSLGPKATLSKLSTVKVTDIGKDLVTIQEIIEKECVGDGGCGLSSQLLNGVTAIQSARQKVWDIWTELSHAKTNNLVKSIKENTDANGIPKLINFMKSMSDNIPQNDNTTTDERTFVESSFGVLHSSKSVQELLSSLKEIAGKSQKTVAAIDRIRIFDDYLESLKSVKTSISTEKTKFDKLLGVSNGDTFKQTRDVLESLSVTKTTPDFEKKMTAGFPNGFQDVEALENIEKDEWLNKLLNPGKDINELSSMLSQLRKLKKKLAPVSTSWNNAKKLNTGSIRNVNLLLNDLSAINGLTETIKSSEECMVQFVIDQKLSTDFRKSVETFTEFEKQISTFEQSIKGQFPNVDVTSGPLSEITKAINASVMKSTELSDKMLAMKAKIASTVTSLESFKKQLDNVKLNDVEASSNSLSASEFKKSLDEFQKWSEETAKSSMTCLENSINSQDDSPAKRLQAFKKGNKDVESVIQLSNALGNLINEYNKAKTSVKQSARASRSVDLSLENSKNISKSLGDMSSTIRKLVQVQKASEDFKVLINLKKEIDSVVEKTLDPNEKEKLQKLWNANTVKALENIQEIAGGLNGVIRNLTEIVMITDFKDPFFTAAEIKGSKVEMRELAGALEGKITNQKLSTSIKKLENLNLIFVKHDKSTMDDVLSELQKYFDSVFEVTRDNCKNDSCTAPDASYFEKNMIWLLPVSIVGGLAIIAAIVIPLYKKFCKKKESTNNNTPSPSNSSTNNTSNTPATGEEGKNATVKNAEGKSEEGKNTKGKGKPGKKKGGTGGKGGKELTVGTISFKKSRNGKVNASNDRPVINRSPVLSEADFSMKKKKISEDENEDIAVELGASQEDVNDAMNVVNKDININIDLRSMPCKHLDKLKVPECLTVSFLSRCVDNEEEFPIKCRPGSEMSNLRNDNYGWMRFMQFVGLSSRETVKIPPEPDNKTAEDRSTRSAKTQSTECDVAPTQSETTIQARAPSTTASTTRQRAGDESVGTQDENDSDPDIELTFFRELLFRLYDNVRYQRYKRHAWKIRVKVDGKVWMRAENDTSDSEE